MYTLIAYQEFESLSLRQRKILVDAEKSSIYKDFFDFIDSEIYGILRNFIVKNVVKMLSAFLPIMRLIHPNGIRLLDMPPVQKLIYRHHWRRRLTVLLAVRLDQVRDLTM